METLFIAENLNRSRALAVAHEAELRRRLADRGVELHPVARLVLSAVGRLLDAVRRPRHHVRIISSTHVAH